MNWIHQIEPLGALFFEMTMSIRIADRDDLSAVLGLYGQLHPSDVRPDSNIEAAVFNSILESKWFSLFVLEIDAQICCSCYLNIIPNISRSARPYAIIENVITDQKMRRRGLGRSIVFIIKTAQLIILYKSISYFA